MKRLTGKACLQKTTSQQILTTTDLQNFCRDNIMTVSFLYAEKKAIDEKRSMLDRRFQGTCAVPGTRSFYQLVPVGHLSWNTTCTAKHLLSMAISMTLFPVCMRTHGGLDLLWK